jgi:hypothetical protein
MVYMSRENSYTSGGLYKFNKMDLENITCCSNMMSMVNRRLSSPKFISTDPTISITGAETMALTVAA